jgi:hypothetical protein
VVVGIKDVENSEQCKRLIGGIYCRNLNDVDIKKQSWFENR